MQQTTYWVGGRGWVTFAEPAVTAEAWVEANYRAAVAARDEAEGVLELADARVRFWAARQEALAVAGLAAARG